MDHDEATDLRNHWWPRPGWRPGRITYTWHLTFENAPELHRLTTEYQAALAGLPGLNPVPLEWLHLTLQAVGYADDITPDQLQPVTDAVRARLVESEAFRLTFHSVHIRGEAIVLVPAPEEPVRGLLYDIQDGIADALGPTAVRVAPEQANGFVPHVSIAYSNIDASALPYTDALHAIATRPAHATVDRVTLIRQDRLLAPHWQYRWTVETEAALGTASPGLSAIAGT